jgi:hypothetical protein
MIHSFPPPRVPDPLSTTPACVQDLFSPPSNPSRRNKARRSRPCPSPSRAATEGIPCAAEGLVHPQAGGAGRHAQGGSVRPPPAMPGRAGRGWDRQGPPTWSSITLE